ncbi:DNA polymerase III subunit alpha [Candidatus Fermentibacteria bacterium]|nr:DNA polymerase III subunit alpha [Candidatus Fermentibacteria bacterium]
MIPLLRCFSFYSFGRGVLSLEALCRNAAQRGITHVALVDTGGVYGLIDFMRLARQHGITPVAGTTLMFPGGPLTFLAASRRGYTSLSRLISGHHAHPEWGIRLLGEAFDPTDLVILGGDPGGLGAAITWAGQDRVYAVLNPGPRAPDAARFAKTWGVRLVVAPHIYLAQPEDAFVHRLQRAVALQSSLNHVRPADLWPTTGVIPPAEEVRRWKEAWPEAWRHTMELGERCAVGWEFQRPIVPRTCESPVEAIRMLRGLAEQGAERRYPRPPPCDLQARLEGELGVIGARGLADYFLLVHEIVHTAGVYATCGRGSGASSVVAYCLGITDVDPIAANLYFERFLGPGRADIPDIDVDFPWDERPRALQRVFASRPPGEVALVANHVTFRSRGAFREAGRVLGLPEARVSELWRQVQRHGATTRDANADVGKDPRTSPAGEVLRMAALLRGFPRHLSRHCGGVVIVPGGVDTVVPCEPLPDGLSVIQWEKDQAEDAGLVKVDLLGNRSLSVVRDAIQSVNRTGVKLTYGAFSPLDDGETQAMLARGATMGIFYVESPAMRQLQAKAATGSFESLVVHSSLIRPAANRWIAEYVRRLRGGSYARIHPFLDHLLAQSRGILCYQEDVMRVAVELAGFDHGLADQLRRTLSGKRGIPLPNLAVRFKEGLRAKGLSKDQVATLWSMVESFAGYSFCKAHSASYALLSFKSAYLKAHHPAEFMAAVLSNGGGYYSAQAYVSEARRMGLAIHGPDVNASAVAYTPLEDAIRIGLGQIKALGEDAARHLVEARADGPFVSLEDMLARCPMPVQAAQGLILAGALDSLHGPGCRIPLLHRLADLAARPRSRNPLLIPPPATWHATPMPSRLARMQEIQTLGFPLEGHPLDLVETPAPNVVGSAEIPKRVGEPIRLMGWYVTAKPVQTRSREDMAFVSFEDRESLFETVIFPEQYRQVRHDLHPDRAYVIEGEITQDWSVCTVEIRRLVPMRPIVYRHTPQAATTLRVHSARAGHGRMDEWTSGWNDGMME